MSKIKIQELSTPGCSHCAATKEILENEIKPNFPNVEIEYIDMLSEEGQKEKEVGVPPSCRERDCPPV